MGTPPTLICRFEAMPTWYEPPVESADAPVYGTARGRLRARIASPLAARARARRHALLFARTGVRPGMRVLDVGCGTLGLRAQEPGLDITGVDLVPRPTYPGPFVQADATQRLPFADGEFDLAYSSSVVEHVPPALRPAFAAEIRRVARGHYVQTPAYSFPVEPHALLPFAHWLPPAIRRPYWRLGAQGDWEDVHLLRRAELAALFGEPVEAERFGGLVKSWVALRPVA
jgi:SAM-dependent methyltransferase